MARDIDFSKLDKADKVFIRQRPWLVDEAKLQGFDIYDAVWAGVEADPEGTATQSVTTEDLRVGTPDQDDDGMPEDSESDDYDEWKVPELKEELEKRELAVGGNKDELIARLREDDAEQ